MAFDEEDLVTKITDGVKNNLNTKIGAINTEKGDFSLDTVSASGYFYMDLGEEAPNYDPYVLFTMDYKPVETVGVGSSEEVSVGIELVFSTKMDVDRSRTFKRVSRYRRALKESAIVYARDFHGFTIKSLKNIIFTENHSEYFVLGISVSFSLAY